MFIKAILTTGLLAGVVPVAGQLLPDPLSTMPLRIEDRSIKDLVTNKIEITVPQTHSLTDWFTIVDTLDSDIKQTDIWQVEGLGLKFHVRAIRDSILDPDQNILSIESHIFPFRRFQYDVTGLDTDSIASVARALRSMPSEEGKLYNSDQNCISYALENIFLFHGIDPQPFFSNSTMPHTFDDLKEILDNFFVLEEIINATYRRAIKRSDILAANNRFIVIRNQAGEPVHAFFTMQDRYWSKNGLFPYTSYTTPLPVIGAYGVDGSTVEVFRFDPSKLQILF